MAGSFDPGVFPDTAPEIDARVLTKHEDGRVTVLFSNAESKKSTERTFDSMERAGKQATFIALTLGVGNANVAKLNEWLTVRGFNLLDEDKIKGVLDTSNIELTE